ncbi:MAG: hypothetical protein DMF61_23415 [Blastocatellia bacterium AA13]|nr:MAG: hypothetical protein DMF61_23415 [Blastocatellia bacterium AA13]
MSTAKSELKLRSEIDKKIGELVLRAEKVIEDLRDKLNRIENNQIKNVLAVANSAPHSAIVTNFIRYQMGRQGAPRKAWSESGLGEKVIQEVDGRVRALASTVASAAGCADVDYVHAKLVSLFLGFLNRSFVFAKANGGKAHVQQVHVKNKY